DGELEYVGDALAPKAHLECLSVVALPLAHLARNVDVREEVHLDLHQPIALARLAPPALHVEREASRPISADLRFRQLGKQLADRREQARVGGRIRSWRAANRALIDVDDLIDVLEPRYAPVRARNHARSVEMPRQRAMQDVLDERRLAGARYTRHGHENAQRDLDVEVAQVVLARALDANHSALVDVASAARR